MDLALTHEEQNFQTQVRATLEARLPEDIRRSVELGIPVPRAQVKVWWAILNELGWAAPAWPSEYGGMGLDPFACSSIIEEFARAGKRISRFRFAGRSGFSEFYFSFILHWLSIIAKIIKGINSFICLVGFCV